MFSFLAQHPLRTRTAHLNSIPFDDGATRITFHSSQSKYLMTNVWPPAPSDETIPGTATNSLSPPYHWHHSQSETFHLLKGTGNFMLEGIVKKVSAPESITIPAGAYHTFCNASTIEGMELEFVLEPRWRESDERFFPSSLVPFAGFPYVVLHLFAVAGRRLEGLARGILDHLIYCNLQNYRDDCRKSEMKPSFFQTMLFLYYGGVVPAIPGPKLIAKPLALLLTYVGGFVIGKWLLGYRESYPEYSKLGVS